jgi:hypothetical protein
LFNAVHACATDVLKIALYTSAASLDNTTTAYTTTGETTGTGYSAGGQPLVVGTTPQATGTTAFMSFNNPAWPAATFTSRGALIYNSSKSNKAIAVIDFGSDKSTTAGTFSIQMPSADSVNAILRIA